jgi:hypothetical protein
MKSGFLADESLVGMAPTQSSKKIELVTRLALNPIVPICR